MVTTGLARYFCGGKSKLTHHLKMSKSAGTTRPNTGGTFRKIPQTLFTSRLKSAGMVSERYRKEFLASSFRERGPVRTRQFSAKERTRALPCTNELFKESRSQQRHKSLNNQSKQDDYEDGNRDKHSIWDSQSINHIKFPSSIDQVIVAFKEEATRRLRPAVLESVLLKSQASPSVKQFLEIYDRPTAIDKCTGKPVPLRRVYEKEIVQRKHRGTTLSSMNKVMGTIATQTEARAGFILRKDPFNNALTENFWTCDLPGLIADTPQTTTPASAPSKVLLEPRRIEGKGIIQRKWHPVYLVPEGYVRALRPRTDSVITDKESMTNEWQLACSHTPDSFFLTGQENHYDTSKTPSESLRFLGWQPLTKSALLEHTRVSEVSAVKKGTYLHNVQRRQHQLWKPQEAIMNYPSSSLSEVQRKPLQDVTDCVSHYNNIGYSDACNNFYKKYSNMYSHFFGFPSDL